MTRFNTLFARTALVIAAGLTAFILATSLLVYHSILSPLGRRAADDLAALMVLSAQTFIELPPATRHAFLEELKHNHRLHLQDHPPGIRSDTLRFTPPYMRFLRDALAKRLGHPVEPFQTPGSDRMFWVGLPMAGRTLYLGFSHDRLGASPLQALVGILAGAGLFVFFSTLLLVRLVTRPLARLTEGVRRLGCSGFTDPLPEDGPQELQMLARKINALAQEIQRLLDHRTILLGGISHDLRTPLSRLEVAVELLDCQTEDTLLRQIRSDLKEMNDLVARTLELAGLMQAEHRDEAHRDLGTLLREIHADHARQGRHFRLVLEGEGDLLVPVLPLRRILNNLLDNAFRYGGGEVRLDYREKNGRGMICVLDSGPGVPETERERIFQPFHRLEPSRNPGTGGSGLGLAIVRQIADSRGWRLTLRNRREGGLAVCLELESLPRTGTSTPGGIHPPILR